MSWRSPGHNVPLPLSWLATAFAWIGGMFGNLLIWLALASLVPCRWSSQNFDGVQSKWCFQNFTSSSVRDMPDAINTYLKHEDWLTPLSHFRKTFLSRTLLVAAWLCPMNNSNSDHFVPELKSTTAKLLKRKLSTYWIDERSNFSIETNERWENTKNESKASLLKYQNSYLRRGVWYFSEKKKKSVLLTWAMTLIMWF